MRKSFTCIWLLISVLWVSPIMAEPPEGLPQDGVLLERPDGSWLHVLVDTNRFVLSFYDREAVQVATDAERGLVRYQPMSRGSEQQFLYLENNQLLSARKVRAPHIFRVSVFLFKGEGSEAFEVHHFDYP